VKLTAAVLAAVTAGCLVLNLYWGKRKGMMLVVLTVLVKKMLRVHLKERETGMKKQSASD